VHVAAAKGDQPVVLSHEAVFSALLEGNLSFDQAVEQGLIVFANDPGGRGQQLFRHALSTHPSIQHALIGNQ
jgi:hypothetical protein